MTLIFFRSMYNKIILVISRIIEISVRVISLSLRLRLITLTSTSIILDITKTLSCILSRHDIMDDKHTVVARNKL